MVNDDVLQRTLHVHLRSTAARGTGPRRLP